MLYTHCMSSLSHVIEQCKWVAVLPATPEGGPHTITASSSSYGKATITDVLFGDVWICGGQSNMVFTVPQVRIIKQPANIKTCYFSGV